MEICMIKKKAWEIFSGNKKKYIIIAILYFTVTVLLTAASSFLNLVIEHGIDEPFLTNYSENLYISYSVKFIETVLTVYFFLWIYSLAFKHPYFKRINVNNTDYTMRFILHKSILIGFVLFFITAPFNIIADIKYSPNNFDAIIFITTINIIALVITFILEFFNIIVFLQPQKSILNSIKKSVLLILKNLGTYIYFNLSFVLWFIVPIAVYFAGIILFFDNRTTQNLPVQVFAIFCLQIMLGLGVYFLPYYNISKFILCESLLNEKEKSEHNDKEKSKLYEKEKSETVADEKKKSVNRKYILKSPINEVLREEVNRNAIRIKEREQAELEHDALLNEINLVVPYEYANKLVDLNWNDVLFAIEQGYFTAKDAVECAKNEISKNKDVPNDVYDLVGLKPTIKDYDEVVHEYVIDFSHRVPKKEKIESKEKIMYVLLNWGFDNKNEYKDPLCFFEKIYENFDSPVAISEFAMNIPDIEDPSIAIDKDMDIFYENWNQYLLGQKSRFSKNRDVSSKDR